MKSVSMAVRSVFFFPEDYMNGSGYSFNLSCSGTTVFAEIQGVIEACVRLTGMPDLTLSFMVGLFPLYLIINCIQYVQYTVFQSTESVYGAAVVM